MRHAPRRAKRIDSNQNVIVNALQCVPGVTVEVGHDDILVGYMGNTYWFELKDESAIGKKTGKVRRSAITEQERTRKKTWRGHYSIVWSLDQILEEIGL